VWNCVDGFASNGQPTLTEPMAALDWVAPTAPRGFYLFKDLGETSTTAACCAGARHGDEDPQHRPLPVPLKQDAPSRTA